MKEKTEKCQRCQCDFKDRKRIKCRFRTQAGLKAEYSFHKFIITKEI